MESGKTKKKMFILFSCQSERNIGCCTLKYKVTKDVRSHNNPKYISSHLLVFPSMHLKAKILGSQDFRGHMIT